MARLLFSNGVLIRETGKSINLTDLWRSAGSPEGVLPHDWLSENQAFIDGEADGADVMVFVSGEATWAHWRVALAYARCLGPGALALVNRYASKHITPNPFRAVKGRAAGAKSTEGAE
jgi:hypothetical protein